MGRRCVSEAPTLSPRARSLPSPPGIDDLGHVCGPLGFSRLGKGVLNRWPPEAAVAGTEEPWDCPWWVLLERRGMSDEHGGTLEDGDGRQWD